MARLIVDSVLAIVDECGVLVVRRFRVPSQPPVGLVAWKKEGWGGWGRPEDWPATNEWPFRAQTKTW